MQVKGVEAVRIERTAEIETRHDLPEAMLLWVARSFRAYVRSQLPAAWPPLDDTEQLSVEPVATGYRLRYTVEVES